MKPTTRQLLAVLGLLPLAAAVFTARATPATAPAHSAALQRGRYLVEQVGMCADCHSPRNEKGEFLRDRWLGGAPLAFQPTVPMPWSPAAPPIAGLPSMTAAQATVFLQTGKRPDGTSPRPPMPEFRFSPDDAAAVAVYLKSLAK